jgi:hypothetical protein
MLLLPTRIPPWASFLVTSVTTIVACSLLLGSQTTKEFMALKDTSHSIAPL